jgi:esterase/lipase superfamily enzyme
MNSESSQRRFAASEQLYSLGTAAIPGLLDALTDPELVSQAATALGRIVGAGDMAETAEMVVGPAMPMAVPPPKAMLDDPVGMELVREVDSLNPTQVRVHFGTNRELIEDIEPAGIHLRNGGVALLMAALMGWFGVRLYRCRQENPVQQNIGCSPVVLLGLLVLAAGWGMVQFNTAWREHYSEREGAHFGGRRASAGQIKFGYCDVSIPPTHLVGEVERPQLGAEDAQEHVILTRAELQNDQAFFAAVKQQLQNEPNRQCFVFVHGYNVTFDDAARRTAQIHYDLKFEGVPLFFSWPSRGGFRHYFSDRNEILVSRQAIRQFLSEVAERSTADKIHVIAHSMGADAVCQAIAELDSDGQIFEQIILAAPDIDADVFEFQLLPQMKQKARRTTLYCSRNDMALYASHRFNDSRRAGDSSEQLVLAEGLDTVDASDMDTELLGHSYYGSCQPLINDLRQILSANLPPSDRDLEPLQIEHPLPAWTFRAWSPDSDLPEDVTDQ